MRGTCYSSDTRRGLSNYRVALVESQAHESLLTQRSKTMWLDGSQKRLAPSEHICSSAVRDFTDNSHTSSDTQALKVEWPDSIDNCGHGCTLRGVAPIRDHAYGERLRINATFWNSTDFLVFVKMFGITGAGLAGVRYFSNNYKRPRRGLDIWDRQSTTRNKTSGRETLIGICSDGSRLSVDWSLPWTNRSSRSACWLRAEQSLEGR